MPFDDPPTPGGGDHGGDHDPHALETIARITLENFSVNCMVNKLCEFHAGIWLQNMMVRGLIATIEKQSGSTAALAMADEQIATLATQLANLKEERSKWPTTRAKN